MWMRHAIVLVGLLGALSPARAQDFRLEEVGSARSVDAAQLKPAVIAFSDQAGVTAAGETNLIHFEDWARTRPNEKKFLSLFAGYIEPPDIGVPKPGAKPDAKSDPKAEEGPPIQKLDMYIAQARFVLDKPPVALDLSRYVTLPFLERIGPSPPPTCCRSPISTAWATIIRSASGAPVARC
jgi:hypothetical protein